jgi:hypothetical protein
MCRVTQLVERNWQTLAACRSADPDLFFPLSSSGKSLGQVTERIGFQPFSNLLLAEADRLTQTGADSPRLSDAKWRDAHAALVRIEACADHPGLGVCTADSG